MNLVTHAQEGALFITSDIPSEKQEPVYGEAKKR